MLSAVSILAGCDKENGDGGVFTPPAQDQLTQNAYADNETTGGGFSFTTDAPWTATVEEVLPQNTSSTQVKSATRSAGNNVVWLKLYNGNSEAYSGEAGTVTLRIEIDQNYTGERREATITIRSGDNTFIVTVIQEGTKQDGSKNEPPVKVTRITLDKTALSLEIGDKATLTATVEPTDATIKSVVWSSSNSEVATVNPETGEITAIADGNAVITATSSSNKEVSASCTVTVGDTDPVVPTGSMLVSELHSHFTESPGMEDEWVELTYDDQNRLIRYKTIWNEISDTGSIVGKGTDTYEYAYETDRVVITNADDQETVQVFLNAAGYAQRVERSRPEESVTVATYKYDAENHLIQCEIDGDKFDYIWENGNLVEVRISGVDGEIEDVTRYTYTDLENREQPDFISAWNEMFSWDESLGWPGLLGVGNKNLLKRMRGDSEWAYKDDFDMEYELDADGYVTKAIEYRIKASGEVDRSNPRICDVKHIAPANK